MDWRTPLDRFDRFVDWFLHPGMAADAVKRKQARLFLLSHILGPFLGNGLGVLLYLVEPEPGFELGMLMLAIVGFWLFPLLLRRYGRLELLAMVSIQHLALCVLWVTYFYGGATSPFLAWVLTIPLLAFFYVGDSRTMRLAILLLLVVNAFGFYLVCRHFAPTGHGLSATALQRLGLFSTAAIGLYVTMMALYYAKALASQAELEAVMRRQMATATELKRAALQSERASLAKVEFVAKMSHELRTPLNAIIGYSQMILEEAEPDDPDAPDLVRIQTAGEHLLKLVNQILDLARIDSGRMEVFDETFGVADLLEAIVEAAQAPAQARGNRLTLEVGPGAERLTADRLKVENAIGQVVGNAVKYTRDGTIAIRAERVPGVGGDALRVSVSDTGIGIPPEHLPTLFEQFAAGDEQTSTKYGGTGLGLALARKLCRLMDGDIAVETEPGRGSRFSLTFPVAPRARQPARDRAPAARPALALAA